MFIGMTGGIASGKNFVAELFAKQGCYTLDADEVSRIVMAKGGEAYDGIVSRFGKGMLKADSELDRGKLRSAVTSSSGERKALEAIVHPAIANYTKKWYKQIKATDDKAIAVYHAPLLIEASVYKDCDAVILIYTSKDTQLERLKKRGYPPFEDGKKFLETQISYEDKLPYADFVVDNDSTPENAEKEVARVFNLIKLMRYGMARQK